MDDLRVLLRNAVPPPTTGPEIARIRQAALRRRRNRLLGLALLAVVSCSVGTAAVISRDDRRREGLDVVANETTIAAPTSTPTSSERPSSTAPPATLDVTLGDGRRIVLSLPADVLGPGRLASTQPALPFTVTTPAGIDVTVSAGRCQGRTTGAPNPYGVAVGERTDRRILLCARSAGLEVLFSSAVPIDDLEVTDADAFVINPDAALPTWGPGAAEPLRPVGGRVLRAGGSASGMLVARDTRSLDVLWSRDIGEGAFVVAMNETTVIATTNFTDLHALDARTGETRWHHGLGEQVVTATAGPTAVVVSTNAPTPTGQHPRVRTIEWDSGLELWATTLTEGASHSLTPPVATDAFVVVMEVPDVDPQIGTRLVALTASTGEVRWRYDLQSQSLAQSELAFRLGPDGDTVVAVNQQRSVVALELATGRRRWQFVAPGSVHRIVSVDDRGIGELQTTEGTLRLDLRSGRPAR